jgi:hypothetical protein
MKRWILIAFATVMVLEIAAPVADAARRRVVHRGPHRKVVVVHRTFPLRRALPAVVVRPARVRVAVAPRVFLAPVVWTAAVVTTSAAVAKPTWEDAETLEREEEWTEFTLNADARGTKLYLEIDGNADLNFAEVVFENGDVQVVDFEEKNHKSGLYSLLDFKDGRKIDHVRMVARAQSDKARIVLRLA